MLLEIQRINDEPASESNILTINRYPNNNVEVLNLDLIQYNGTAYKFNAEDTDPRIDNKQLIILDELMKIILRCTLMLLRLFKT